MWSALVNCDWPSLADNHLHCSAYLFQEFTLWLWVENPAGLFFNVEVLVKECPEPEIQIAESSLVVGAGDQDFQRIGARVLSFERWPLPSLFDC